MPQTAQLVLLPGQIWQARRQSSRLKILSCSQGGGDQMQVTARLTDWNIQHRDEVEIRASYDFRVRVNLDCTGCYPNTISSEWDLARLLYSPAHP
jgi:hypothetical protein